jgi:hypothetical protein
MQKAFSAIAKKVAKRFSDVLPKGTSESVFLITGELFEQALHKVPWECLRKFRADPSFCFKCCYLIGLTSTFMGSNDSFLPHLGHFPSCC